MRFAAVSSGVVAAGFLLVSVASAWTGPGSSPPSGNVSAPINVGSTAQVKNGDIGFNYATAFGDIHLVAGWAPTPSTITYLNFSNAQYPSAPTWGSSGYGFRDNNGVMEFKNSGGSWTSLQGAILGATSWTTSGANIYNSNSGNVGVGTASPSNLLDIGSAALGTLAGKAMSISNTAGNSVIGFGQSSTARARLAWVYNATEANSYFVLGDAFGTHNLVLQDGGGNVGIGTASPGQKLTVAGTIESTSGGVKFPDGTTQTTAATAGLGGSGTANYIPKFTAASTIGNSTISDDGTTVNIGSASFHSGGAVAADNYLPFSNGNNYIRPKAGGVTYVRSGIYDEDNAAYYMDPSGGSNFNAVSANDYYANSWFRLNGAGTGLYWQLYGTSITASDSTWVRVNPYLYTNQGYDSGGPSAAGCGGGLGGGYTFRVCGTAAATAFIYSSDRRLKDNIKPIDNSLWKVLQLTGVSFNWNSGERKGQADIGVIAQDVQKIAPEAVHTDAKGMLSVDYPRLTPLLINAIKEQEAKIAVQQKEIDELKAAVKALQAK